MSCSLTHSSSIAQRLIDSLLEGKVVVIPTDTVYGVLSLSEESIIQVKHRDVSRKKTVRFVHHRSQISPQLPQGLNNLLDKYWPGSLTVIYRGIGYRCPNSPYILEALKKINQCIYASSANITSRPVVTSIEEAKQTFKDSNVPIEFIDVCGAKTTQASTVYDYDNRKILREGNIGLEDLLRREE